MDTFDGINYQVPVWPIRWGHTNPQSPPLRGALGMWWLLLLNSVFYKQLVTLLLASNSHLTSEEGAS